MKVRIIAAGKVRSGPEGVLANSYLERFGKAGRSIGLGPAKVVEFDSGPQGRFPEQQVEQAAASRDAVLCALDENGKRLTSSEFAECLAGWRDRGLKEAVFLIGGADGLRRDVRDRAEACLSLGQMVLPHLLARVVLAEQLYRAVSILRGTPYHRG